MEDLPPPRKKRFTFKSYERSLKSVHLPSPTAPTTLDIEISDNASHFNERLEHLRQLNLAPAFVRFAEKACKLSESMAILLYNFKEIVELWLTALGEVSVGRDNGESYKPLLELMKALLHDLRSTMVPMYGPLLQALLPLTARKLEPEALTELLSTLLSFFKYLLIPALQKADTTPSPSSVLSLTWRELCKTFEECGDDGRRMLGEVWGATLRRMSANQRSTATAMMIKSLGMKPAFRDGIAWAVVEASQAPSRSLHPCAPAVLRTILDVFLEVDPETEENSDSLVETATLLRRVLTSMVHHVSGATELEPITMLLVDVLRASLSTVPESPSGVKRLTRMMEVVQTPCIVRNGSRVSQGFINDVLGFLGSIAHDTVVVIENQYCSLLVVALSAADMMTRIGAGGKALIRIWEVDSIGLRVSGCLADANWDAWSNLVLPGVTKNLPRILKSDSTGLAQRFLSTPSVIEKLRNTSQIWIEEIHAWAASIVTSWDPRSPSNLALFSVLAIAPSLGSSFQLELRLIIQKILQTFPSDCASASTVPAITPDSAIVLAKSISALLKIGLTEIDGTHVAHWVKSILTPLDGKQGPIWVKYPILADDVATLCVSRSNDVFRRIPFEDLVTSLRPACASHDRRVRLASLSILHSYLSLPNVSPAAKKLVAVVDACRAAEFVPLEVSGMRERVLRTRRVALSVLKAEDERGVELATRWLLAQLQINLRPLWAPTQEAISSLLESYSELVWRLVFEELEHAVDLVSTEAADKLPTLDSDSPDSDGLEKEEPSSKQPSEQEQHKTWRCPNAEKQRALIRSWALAPDVILQNSLRKMRRSPDRLDARNYEIQLLGIFERAPTMPEKRSRTFVPFFLALEPRILPRRRLKAYLDIFANFSNPKALHGSSVLLDLYLSFLSVPDRGHQECALNCLLTYKSPVLMRYESQFRALLDETKWRDEMSLIDLSGLPEDHRPEFVRLLIALLYGLIGERKGRKQGSADRRAVILQVLSECSPDELGRLVDLMLGAFPPASSQPRTSADGGFHGLQNSSTSQQAGYLSLLGDFIRVLGAKGSAYWPRLLSLTIEIVHASHQMLDSLPNLKTDVDEQTSTHSGDNLHDDESGKEQEERAPEVDVHSQYPLNRRVYRTLRQDGLKRMTDLFRVSPTAIDYSPYVALAFPSFITPHLTLLPRENTQEPSALLELLIEWTASSTTVPYLVRFNLEVLPRLFECLNGGGVKPSVIMKTFDAIERLLALSEHDEAIATLVLQPHSGKLLAELATMFERLVKAGLRADVITQRLVDILPAVSVYTTRRSDANRLLSLIQPLLTKPNKIIPEKIKTNLLHVMRQIVQLIPEYRDPQSTIFAKGVESLGALFRSFQSRTARQELVTTFVAFSDADESLLPLCDAVQSLNAYSTRGVDQPDFDRRLGTFALLNETLHSSFHSREWRVIIANMMFFIQDPEEVAVRSSAAQTLRLFIQAVSDEAAQLPTPRDSPLYQTFDQYLYPTLRNALRSKFEQVRGDLLSVVAYAVEHLSVHPALFELTPLLADGDAEANFFNNILHIQVHRRTRALRRLADFTSSTDVRKSTVVDIFVPITEHFVVAAEALDHHLVNEAITTLGILSSKLSWSAYNALVLRHLAAAKDKNAIQKTRVRSLVAILEHFPFQVADTIETDVPDEAPEDQHNDVAGVIVQENVMAAHQHLQVKISDTINQRLLPSLLAFMEQREDTEDVVRLPIALGIAHVAQRLPEAPRLAQLGKIIILLSQALRSKSQETRDVVRDTLAKLTIMLGPDMLPEILKQLKAALLRGPQLHILAFVAHSLLIHVTSPEHLERFKHLDESVASIAYISAEVVFGQSGRDVKTEGFKTQVREVRGSVSRGLDNFATAAKYISPGKIAVLLNPIRAIMHETKAAKTMQQVDDVLRRIAGGLNANESLPPADLLTLCHTLISQNSKFLEQHDVVPKSGKRREAEVDVQLKRQEVALGDAYAHNSFRFVAWGLDLFITAYRRGRFDFQNADVLSRLESMVGVIGNTLYSSNSAVMSLGVRAAAAIAKCPLQTLTHSLPVYMKRIFAVIREAGSTDSEMIQHTFKSLAIIIRDCPTAKVRDEDLTFLLEVLIPDIEENDRQIAVFALLRAIVGRKLVVPEMYDVMMKVSEIMVTNQSTHVQELCRGVLLQFLLDYPQGKGRLRNQMTFLAKNLSYLHESGRLSVMEILGAIIVKFHENIIQEYSELFSTALLMVLANDESPKCREVATELIKSLHGRSSRNIRDDFHARLHLWVRPTNPLALRCAVAQIYGVIVDATSPEEVITILHDLDAQLVSSALALSSLQAMDNQDQDAFAEESNIDWQLPYQTISSITKTFRVAPDILCAPNGIHWDAVQSHLVFPHTWVRLAASRLLGALCGAFPPSLPDPRLPSSHPLSREGVVDLAHKLCTQLKSEHLDDALSLQVVKNLFYVGKCFQLWPESRIFQSSANAAVDEGKAETGSDEEHEVKGHTSADHAENKMLENPLRWLFSRMSYQARSAHLARRNRKLTTESSWAAQVLATLRWFAAMSSCLPSDDLANFLTHILSPVYRILEDDTIRDSNMEELRSTAQELQTMVQEKVGTMRFAAEYSRIRQGILTVRRDRRTTNALQKTTLPDVAAKRKAQRNMTKKASRKRKHQEFSEEKIKHGLKRARFDR